MKIDLTQKIQRLENEKMTQKEMYDKIDKLKNELDGMCYYFRSYVIVEYLWGMLHQSLSV